MNILSQRLESDLGCWTHTEWRPDGEDPLGWGVERVWDFDGMAAMPRERVFPNGLVELILQLDDRYLDVHETGTTLTPAACVTGIYSKALLVEAPRRPCRVMGVCFRPPGAWAVLAHPLWELADLTADLDDLLGGAGMELAEQCYGVRSGTERVRRVVAWLGRRLLCSAAPGAVDPTARWIAGCIARTGGRTPIGSLRARAGLTNARLSALFREQVGVTPKRYARIHRFGRALALLSQRSAGLGQIALRAGYYDQPHMNAEFRNLAGLTPRQLLTARHYPNSPSLPESA